MSDLVSRILVGENGKLCLVLVNSYSDTQHIYTNGENPFMDFHLKDQVYCVRINRNSFHQPIKGFTQSQNVKVDVTCLQG